MRLILVMNMTPFWILMYSLEGFKLTIMKKTLRQSCQSELQQVSLKKYFYIPNSSWDVRIICVPNSSWDMRIIYIPNSFWDMRIIYIPNSSWDMNIIM